MKVVTAAAQVRVLPDLADVRTDIPMPVRIRRGGPKSHYDFASLAAPGASFGVKNKTSAQIGPIVSKENKRNRLESVDPTNQSRKVVTYSRKYEVFDVDPKTDPDGAKCRVFRTI